MAEANSKPLYRLLTYELAPHRIEGQLTVILRLGESDRYGIGTNLSQGVEEVHFLLDRDELDRFHRELELTLLGFGDFA